MRPKKKILERAKPIAQNPWGNPLGYIGFGSFGCPLSGVPVGGSNGCPCRGSIGCPCRGSIGCPCRGSIGCPCRGCLTRLNLIMSLLMEKKLNRLLITDYKKITFLTLTGIFFLMMVKCTDPSRLKTTSCYFFFY